MTSYYRQKLVEAVQALVDHGDLNTRLTYAAGCLLQIDDDDVPADTLERFESVRDPLIGKPMVAKGEMLPRDLEPAAAKAAACQIVDLLAADWAARDEPFRARSRLDATPAPSLGSYTVTTLRTSPDTLILAFLSERTQATAPAIQAACRMTPGEVRSRLAHLESLRHVTSRQDMRLVPPARVFLITSEGRRKVSP